MLSKKQGARIEAQSMMQNQLPETRLYDVQWRVLDQQTQKHLYDI